MKLKGNSFKKKLAVMGKPVSKKPLGKAPSKREREPTPPSEPESFNEEDVEMDEEDMEMEGQPIPSIDYVLLAKLREAERKFVLGAMLDASREYRTIRKELCDRKNTYILKSLQPAVQTFLKGCAEVNNGGVNLPFLNFYYHTIKTASLRAAKQLNASNMRLASLAMKYQELDRATQDNATQDGVVHVPFTMEDIVPQPQLDIGDELFTEHLTAVTKDLLVDDAAIDVLPERLRHESFQAVQFTFHFTDGHPAFAEKQLRLRFYAQGGAMYPQAEYSIGRIVAVEADRISWTSNDARQNFETQSSHLAFFRTWFSGLLPTISTEVSAFKVPAAHITMRKVLEKHLGSLLGLPVEDFTATDFGALNVFDAFEEKGIAIGRMSSREASMNESDCGRTAKKIAAYFDKMATLVVKGDAMSLEDELNLVRHAVLLNAQIHPLVVSVLGPVATDPAPIAMSAPPTPDDAGDEEDEEDEGDEEEDEEEGEEEEEDDEEDEPTPPPPRKKAAGGPANATKKPEPECKQQ